MVLFTLRMQDNVVYDMSTYMRSLLPRNWYHVAATFDGVAARAIIYINGVEVLRSDRDASRKLRNPLAMTKVPLTVGRCTPAEKNIKNMFHGLLGRVRMWHKTLSLYELRHAMYHDVDDKRDQLDPDWKPALEFDSTTIIPEAAPTGVLDKMPPLTISPIEDIDPPVIQDAIDIIVPVDRLSWPFARSQLLNSILYESARSIEARDVKIRLVETEKNAVGKLESLRCFLVVDANNQKSKIRITVHRAGSKRTWSTAVNSAIAAVESPWFVIMDAYTHVVGGWIRALSVRVSAVPPPRRPGAPTPLPVRAVVPRTLYPSGLVRTAGMEFYIAPTVDSDEALPFDRLRGVPLGYRPSITDAEITAFNRFCVLLNTKAVQEVISNEGSAFNAQMEPGLNVVDFSLRLSGMVGPSASKGTILYAPASIVFYENENEVLTEASVMDYMFSDTAMRSFLKKWGSALKNIVEAKYETSVRLKWIQHCGGSQGLEGAYLVSGLEKRNPLRLSLRRYHRCEWFDTLGKLPGTYRDAMERTRLKTWGTGKQDQVVVYERDYRELGMWIDPERHDAYAIGRYMFEADGLHLQWIEQCKNLHEVWVPSEFHIDMFASQGIPREKLFKVPESIDIDLYDETIIEPMYLPRRKKWAFLSVFKMEERKGWKDLITAYFKEFTAEDDVSLFIHTYVLNVPGDNFDAKRINKMIMDYAEIEGLVTDRLPHFHVMGRFLSTPEMLSLYRAADAFVLPTHGEGWGMALHEAMAMGKPTVATRWSGNTEFMTDDTAYLIDIEKMVPSDSSDQFVQGFKWAQASIPHLRRILREIYTNQNAAREKGQKARERISELFSRDAVSTVIIQHLKRIEKTVKFPVKERAAIDVSIMSNIEHDFRVCLAGPHIDEDGTVHQRAPVPDRHFMTADLPRKIAVVSTFPPRMCGIGIFTNSLLRSMKKVMGGPEADFPVEVIPMALDVHHDVYDPKLVKMVIRRDNMPDYYAAADYINDNFRALLIQHEFGIFGGTAGTFLLCMMGIIKVPIIITLHTIKEELTDTEHVLLQELVRLSTHVVVMNELSTRYLDVYHSIPLDSVMVIPHGVPQVEFVNNDSVKPKFGLEGKLVMVSLGLIGPGKGLEYVMEALPTIVKEVPNFMMVIAGQPHPACGKLCHDYYKNLHRTVRKYGLVEQVKFLKRSFSDEDLVLLVQATDLFITAYPEATVSSSGTASLAMAAGRVVISTPFTWSRDALRDERGVLVPFRDPHAIARAVIELARDPERRAEISKNAYAAGQTMLWTQTASSYVDLLFGNRAQGSGRTNTTAPTGASSRPAVPSSGQGARELPVNGPSSPISARDGNS